MNRYKFFCMHVVVSMVQVIVAFGMEDSGYFFLSLDENNYSECVQQMPIIYPTFDEQIIVLLSSGNVTEKLKGIDRLRTTYSIQHCEYSINIKQALLTLIDDANVIVRRAVLELFIYLIFPQNSSQEIRTYGFRAAQKCIEAANECAAVKIAAVYVFIALVRKKEYFYEAYDVLALLSNASSPAMVQAKNILHNHLIAESDECWCCFFWK